MKSFLSQVIKDFISQKEKLEHTTFVLPSRRACVFLKNQLIKNINGTTMLPKIVSIENFMQELADIDAIENTQLLFEFYTIYKKQIPKNKAESFEVFSQWATIALNDFNEIDAHLVNANAIFSNLSDIKKLQNWFPKKQPSELAIKYLHFFENLELLYNELYRFLSTNKIGYQGLIYRESVKNLEHFIANNNKNKCVFVGFNALNKAEEIIFQELLAHDMAAIYWDINKELLQEKNEAGTFIRAYKNNWDYYKKNPFLWINNVTENQNINIIGVPKNITQVKYAGEILSKQHNFNKTALILADENLLSPAINGLPNTIKNINITMGYPLKDIPVATVFYKLFKLYLNQQKFNKAATKQFYYKDVLNLLNDAFLNKIHGEILQNIRANINSGNAIFITNEMIIGAISKEAKSKVDFAFQLFSLKPNVNEIIKSCLHLINHLKIGVQGIEKEYLFKFYNVFQQLETLNLKYGHIANLKMLSNFYQQLIKTEKLSFQGEPLQGLQVMGMLESRTLDFDTLVITSVNEGILPRGKNTATFIPFDVKKHFKLPTFKEKDAIFSYHFKRLLQRAKEVFLIYNTENDGYGQGEASRFITQLKVKNPEIKEIVVRPETVNYKLSLVTIDKTEAIQQKLVEVFSNGISPSALASYIYNPLQFYEKKILKIREDDLVEETIEANTLGTVVHETLKALYEPYKNNYLEQNHFQAMQQKIAPVLSCYFEQYYPNGNIDTGKNKIIFEVAKSYVQRFLRLELKQIIQGHTIKILETEQKYSCELPVEGLDFPIKLNGEVDRIDEYNGITRIIDYKTGKVEANQLKILDFSVMSDDYKYTKALQVMLYAYLYLNNNESKKHTPIQAGIYSFKNLNSGFLKMNFSNKRNVPNNLITIEQLDNFAVELKRLIKEILNPNIPFTQNINLPF